MTRGRVVVVTVLVLAALDAGRSLWARLGFAQPRSQWRPDPAEFASIAWPPGVDAKPRGREISRSGNSNTSRRHREARQPTPT